MRKTLLGSVTAVALAGAALAQQPQDHQQHHPAGEAPTAQMQPAPGQPAPTPPPMQPQMPMGQMMQNMPEQCRAMMQGCMGMMQGGVMRGGMMQGQSGQSQSEAAKAYMAAMDRMHGPMMQAAQEGDPDVAFVKGMIPHHQGAIEMAKVVLQVRQGRGGEEVGQRRHPRAAARDRRDAGLAQQARKVVANRPAREGRQGLGSRRVHVSTGSD